MLRVYHLAKELAMPRIQLLEHIRAASGDRLFSLSPLNAELVQTLREEFAPPPPPPAPEPVAEPVVEAAPAQVEVAGETSATAAQPAINEPAVETEATAGAEAPAEAPAKAARPAPIKEQEITLPMPELRSFKIVRRASEAEAMARAQTAATKKKLLDKRAEEERERVAKGEPATPVVPESAHSRRPLRPTAEKPRSYVPDHKKKVAGRERKEQADVARVSEALREVTNRGVAVRTNTIVSRSFPSRGRRGRRPMHTGRVRPRKRKKVSAPIVRPESVTLAVPVTIGEMSNEFAVRAAQLIGFAMKPPHAQMLRINDFVPEDLILAMGEEFGIAIEFKRKKDLEEELIEMETEPETLEDGEKELLPLRAPIVTFLGHVDHGKTTLLDYIRKEKVAAGESGGITQHVSCYRVETDKGPITFVDTPGHAAFTEMRSRGADITDVVVLVVAADDGVMPQTEEAINHAKAAQVPIVVALTKIDLEDLNLDKVKTQLSNLGLQPEEWGGETQICPLSAKTGDGVDGLLEMLALEAELLDLRADPERAAYGVIIESYLDEGRGNTAVALIANGTLNKGDLVVAGTGYGKVRALYSDRGGRMSAAGPATPAHIIGLNALPAAGDKFYVLEDSTKAKTIATRRMNKARSASLVARTARTHVTLENLKERLEEEQQHEIKVIIKADVQGSIEALKAVVNDVSTSEFHVRILHAAVGGINESDVILADASDAIVIGFHVVADERARNLAREKGVDVRLYQVIYKIADELKASMEGMLAPEEKEVEIGRVIVRATFKSSAVGTIAGCFVEDGKVERNCKIRVSRDGIIRHEGQLQSLKRFKDDAKEVLKGFECGIKIKDYDDVREDDRIVCYQTVQVARTL